MSLKKKLTMAAINSFCMSFLMSLIMIIINVGFGDRFLGAWLKSFGIAILITFPLSCFLPPVVRKLVDRWFD